MSAERIVFKQRLLEAGVLELAGYHHEFAYGTHGQKLDFDSILTESNLYDEWVVLGRSDFVPNSPSPADSPTGAACSVYLLECLPGVLLQPLTRTNIRTGFTHV